MPHTIAEKVRRWTLEDSPVADFHQVQQRIEYFADTRYYEYLPTIGPYPNFRMRLRDWLHMLTNEDDQKTLFRLVPEIFFITAREFAALYRAAFRGPITGWFVDTLDLNFGSSHLDAALARAAKETWFCPVTDSMAIAPFFHANHIEGQDLRPDWQALADLGCRDKLIAYMIGNSLKRIVLLEDFVGSGTQMQKAIGFAAELGPQIPVLAVPLVICPKGAEVGEQMEGCHPNVRFTPLLALPKSAFVCRAPVSDEPPLFPLVRDLLLRLNKRVEGRMSASSQKYAGPFGFKETGALLVTHSNCPDNTLSLIHHRSDSWEPLFPRSSRV